MPLAPDLERVGDALVAAATRDVAARRRRALLARAGATGVVAALTLAPAGLGPAQREPGLLLARAPITPSPPAACDQPRGPRGALPGCATGAPVPLGRPRRW
jgi:hypothetical protein